MDTRVILHCDLNNFFASVEVMLNPELLGNPVAVCGDPEERKGIVLAKCEMAKKAGVKTGDTVWMAEQKCPGIQIVKPKHNRYGEFSRKVRDVYYKFTDKIESFGIDECWLDVTDSMTLFGTGEEIAYKIKSAVKEELGLTISVGVSWNKTFAKLGSDIKKPDAVTVVSRENYHRVVWKLPVQDMLFVGRKTARMMEKLSIKTIGDLANFNPDLLAARIGITAYRLVEAAQGECDSEVKEFHYKSDVKSVGNGTTLPKDLFTLKEVEQVIYILSEEVGTRMRRKCVRGYTINVSVRDENLKWIGAQESIKTPTDNARTITDAAINIFCKLTRIDRKRQELAYPVHSIRVAVSNLTQDKCAQLDLFNDGSGEDAETELTNIFDKIRKKHGSKSLAYGVALGGQMELDFEVLDE
ncbi:MAG: DNA polymerase IV [Firmicutes bacterium]|nr:DNA polymerase IV [Bacillota bacterium]